MSKGLGKTQRAILAHLATLPVWVPYPWEPGAGYWRAWATTTDLCQVIYGDTSEASRVAVRRAYRSLAAAGLVETGDGLTRGRTGSMSPRIRKCSGKVGGATSAEHLGSLGSLDTRDVGVLFGEWYNSPRGENISSPLAE